MNRRIDIATLAAAAVVFATGLVLLLAFHAGPGALRGEAMGVPRLVWVNVHRLAAVAAVVGVGVHGWRHRRGVMARLRRPAKASRSDLVLYFGFMVSPLAALVAWFLVPGSPPLSGPIRLGHLAHARNLWIDLHHLSSLVLLPAVVIHVRRHLGALR